MKKTANINQKDQPLISGIINGDNHTIQLFYRENIRYIQGYILKNCGNPEDVEDVFQDALVILYQKLRSGFLEINISLKAYFYGICKNIWRNRLRKKTKLIADDTLIIIKEEMQEPEMYEVENNQREHLYRKHFQNLSKDNRNVLSLFFEGKSMHEISNITGYSEAYTRKKKFQAKKQLINMIEQDPLYSELRISC